MARRSNLELRSMSVIDLEKYAEEHPKEGMRVASVLGESSAKIVYGVIKRKVSNCCSTTATYTYSTRIYE